MRRRVFFLFVGQERGTLLLPSGEPFDAPEYPVRPAEPVALTTSPDQPAANDDLERQAA